MMRYQSGFGSAGPRLMRGDHFRGRIQRGADQSAETGPDPVDRVAEHRAGCGAEGRAPDHRVEQLAGAASSASVRFRHARSIAPVVRPALIS